MKANIVTGLAVTVLVVTLAAGAVRMLQIIREGWAMEFPVEGLVIEDEHNLSYEQVPIGDIRNLSRVGFPQAMRHLDARIRHLVIYLDCHYFFTTDGRVIVMTLGGGDGKPQLVETKHWRGAPHDFRDYRKELLPST
jgi:hypothetical protein